MTKTQFERAVEAAADALAECGACFNMVDVDAALRAALPILFEPREFATGNLTTEHDAERIYATCPKCGGLIPQAWAYRDGYRCWRCHPVGEPPAPEPTEERHGYPWD